MKSCWQAYSGWIAATFCTGLQLKYSPFSKKSAWNASAFLIFGIEDSCLDLYPAFIMKTIEVIEDDIGMRSLISEWLLAEGYSVRARSYVGNASEADVDLVLVNLSKLLGGGGGIDTVRQVKRLYAKAALIGLSTQVSCTMPVNSEQASLLGLARLVSKPCRRNELLGAVAAAIGVAT
jgi:CheY-like chemotaxis protein